MDANEAREITRRAKECRREYQEVMHAIREAAENGSFYFLFFPSKGVYITPENMERLKREGFVVTEGGRMLPESRAFHDISWKEVG